MLNIKEFMYYMRLINIYEELIEKKAIIDNFKINTFLKFKFNINNQTQEYRKPMSDPISLDTISNKYLEKIIDLFNKGDSYYFNIILESPFLLVDIYNYITLKDASQ